MSKSGYFDEEATKLKKIFFFLEQTLVELPETGLKFSGCLSKNEQNIRCVVRRDFYRSSLRVRSPIRKPGCFTRKQLAFSDLKPEVFVMLTFK
jgi:hypothetical protein